MVVGGAGYSLDQSSLQRALGHCACSGNHAAGEQFAERTVAGEAELASGATRASLEYYSADCFRKGGIVQAVENDLGDCLLTRLRFKTRFMNDGACQTFDSADGSRRGHRRQLRHRDLRVSPNEGREQTDSERKHRPCVGCRCYNLLNMRHRRVLPLRRFAVIEAQ